jgi:hypothetical protein
VRLKNAKFAGEGRWLLLAILPLKRWREPVALDKVADSSCKADKYMRFCVKKAMLKDLSEVEQSKQKW